MPLRHAAHAVYDCQYHLVWTPKYRKAILDGAKGERMEALLREIAHAYEVEIVEMAVAVDHVHILCSFPPRWSISQVVSRFKSLSARALFREFPQLRRQLWGGELWEGGYFVRTVGDATTGTIKRYVARHGEGDPEKPGQEPDEESGTLPLDLQ